MNQDRASTITNSQLKEGYKQTEVGIVPENWIVDKFSNITNLITCGLAATPVYVEEQYGRPFLSAQNVRNGRVVYDKHKFIGHGLFAQITKHNKPSRGDILYTRVGAGIGEAGVIEDDYEFGIYVSLTLIKVDRKKASSMFISYILNSDRYQFLAKNGQFAGGGVQNLNVEVVREFYMPIPSLLEQDAIACTLSDIDALIESLDRLLTKKRQIKQGAMQELLRSKEGWVDKSLGEIGRCLRGVSYNPNTDLYSHDTDCTIRLLRSNNIQNSNLVFTDLQFVDSVRMSESQQLRSKDVVICMANGSKHLVGKAGKFLKTDEFIYTFGSFMSCFRGNQIFVDRDFVFYLFQTNKYKTHIANLLAGSSINNLCPSSIESFSIPIPLAREEQIEIANILSDMDAEIGSIESKLTKTRQLKQGMMHELLTGRIRLVD